MFSYRSMWNSDHEHEEDEHEEGLEKETHEENLIYVDGMKNHDTVSDRDELQEAIDKYYELKNRFHHAVQQDNKRRRVLMQQRKLHAPQLPCVNCLKRSTVGTKFTASYHPEKEGTSGYRILSAKCGDYQNPCNFHIEIHLAEVVSVETMIRHIQEEIRVLKEEIVCDKNRLLFSTEKDQDIVDRFEVYKEQINELSKAYEVYFRQYMGVVHNVEKRDELDAKLGESYQLIKQIKDSIRLLVTEDDRKYAADAVNIYSHQLQNVLEDIRKRKYQQNAVQRGLNNECVLVQQVVTPKQFEVAVGNYKSKVVKFEFGRTLKIRILPDDKKEKKDKNDDETIDVDGKGEDGKDEDGKDEDGKDDDITDEDMVGGQDSEEGIVWKNPKCQQIWGHLSEKMRHEFKSNVTWMKDFMRECCAKENEECVLIAPPNLILPPKKSHGNEYDFGVTIYNTVFNKLPESLQRTYLTFFSQDSLTKAKDYSKLEDVLNDLVAKELDFKTFFSP